MIQKYAFQMTFFCLGALFTGLVLSGCQRTLEPSQNKNPQEIGQKIYSENCASCHGFSGAGSSMLLEGKNIHFNEPQWQKKYTDVQLQQIIQNGRGSMPSFNGLFSKSEETALVSYIRTLGQ